MYLVVLDERGEEVDRRYVSRADLELGKRNTSAAHRIVDSLQLGRVPESDFEPRR